MSIMMHSQPPQQKSNFLSPDGRSDPHFQFTLKLGYVRHAELIENILYFFLVCGTVSKISFIP
jgi:hypothetical protein